MCLPSPCSKLPSFFNTSDAINAVEAKALQAVKVLLLLGDSGQGGPLDTWRKETEPCKGWVGVMYDNASKTVTSLNLTAIDRRVSFAAPALPILDVISAIANLTHLETLVLSNLGLSGPLDDPTRPALGLHTLWQLQHLDISGNPGISGTLPDKWYMLTSLQVLDVSGCGISGTLPPLYMSLQKLKVLRCVNCPGITGTLPPEYGLLKLDSLQLTNTALTGTLPSEWVNPVAMRRMAAAALQALALQTASSNTGSARAAENSTSTAGVAATQATMDGMPMGLQQLRVLDLSVSGGGRGGLSGSLPGAFAAMQGLQVLALAGHTFNGSLPIPWTSLDQLRVLDIAHNQLSGTLPQSYISMTQLTILKANDNTFVHVKGSMPEFYESLKGNSFNLQCLCVANNSEVLLSEAGKIRLVSAAQQSSPPVQLVIDEPSSSQCDVALLK